MTAPAIPHWRAALDRAGTRAGRRNRPAQALRDRTAEALADLAAYAEEVAPLRLWDSTASDRAALIEDVEFLLPAPLTAVAERLGMTPQDLTRRLTTVGRDDLIQRLRAGR